MSQKKPVILKSKRFSINNTIISSARNQQIEASTQTEIEAPEFYNNSLEEQKNKIKEIYKKKANLTLDCLDDDDDGNSDTVQLSTPYLMTTMEGKNDKFLNYRNNSVVANKMPYMKRKMNSMGGDYLTEEQLFQLKNRNQACCNACNIF